MKIKYVEFYYPGCFCSETNSVKLKPNQKIELPRGAYAYRTFEREEAVVSGEKLLGRPKCFGKMHIKGEAYTLDQVKRMKGNHRILISNMQNNGYKKVVKCAQGFIPFESDMVLL